MNLLDAIILGLVEGITEYLPVSSTGHLIIAQALLGLNQTASAASLNAFTIVIQGGAILAVLGLYWNRVVQMIRGVLGRDRAGLRLLINLIVAFLPAAVLGVLLGDWIERHLFFFWPVLAALALGGVVMILIGRWQRAYFGGDEHAEPHSAHDFVDLEHLTWKRGLLIGLMQCLALWPGASRAMTTIVGGMLVGMRPRQAAEFSFLLGLPTLGGACGYKLLKNLRGDGPNLFDQLGSGAVIVGLIVAAISAAIAVKWLVSFLNRHGLAAFGWYRIALCVVLALLVWSGRLMIAPAGADSAPLRVTTPASAPPAAAP